MRVITSLVLAALFMFGSALPASAQLGRLKGALSGAVERKVNQRMDAEIEKLAERMVSQAFDGIFTGDTTTSPDGRKLFNLLPNAPTEKEYNFDVVITYELESSDQKGKSEGRSEMLMHFARNQPWLGTRIVPEQKNKDGGEVFAIFDMKNQSMVMLMEADKNKFSMAYGWRDATGYLKEVGEEAAADAGDEVTAGNLKFTRIGSKKIAGYQADGYRHEADGETMEIWVSRDPAIAFGGLLGAASSMKQLGALPRDYPAGMMLELTNTSKGGEKSHLLARKVDDRAKVRIVMADYPPLQGAGK